MRRITEIHWETHRGKAKVSKVESGSREMGFVLEDGAEAIAEGSSICIRRNGPIFRTVGTITGMVWNED